MGFPAGLVTLIVNPAAGRGEDFLAFARSESCSALFAEYGCRIRVWPTEAEPGSATKLARLAVADSTLILACGGDGTASEVLQGVVGTGVAFGVVPVGTHNALARSLGLQTGSVGLGQVLGFQPRMIPLAVAQSGSAKRWFELMCGVGASGALAHVLASTPWDGWKKRFGRIVYLAAAGWLFCTRRWPEFSVAYRISGSENWVEAKAVEVLVSRVPNLGGAFAGLTRGTQLAGERLQVQLVRGPGHTGLLAWMTLSRLGIGNPWVQSVEVDALRCWAESGQAVAVQVDAEPMGFLPVTMSVELDAITMMVPVGGVR